MVLVGPRSSVWQIGSECFRGTVLVVVWPFGSSLPVRPSALKPDCKSEGEKIQGRHLFPHHCSDCLAVVVGVI